MSTEYHERLKQSRTAREEGALRRQVKGTEPISSSYRRDTSVDSELLSGEGIRETGDALMRRVTKPEETLDEDFIDTILKRVYENNKTLKGMMHEDTGVFEPIDTRSMDVSVNDQYSTDSFLNKLLQSESSNRFNLVTVSDPETGEKVFGGFQFSEGRLADYKRATGDKFTIKKFLSDPKLQMRVTEWHIADLDAFIDTLDRSKFTSRDGLRAVGHLGGRTGLKKFVASGGKHNPSDRFGTSLMAYYNKFK